MAGRISGKIKLQSVDELLGVPEIAGTQEIEISRIHTFPNHPFKVLDNEKRGIGGVTTNEIRHGRRLHALLAGLRFLKIMRP